MECVFVTVFARALHRSVFWAKWIQFTQSLHISVRHILVLLSLTCWS